MDEIGPESEVLGSAGEVTEGALGMCHEVAESGRSTEDDREDIQGDQRLFQMLMFGATVRAAAQAAGMSERTAYRRLSDPKFRQRLEKARSVAREGIVQRLTDAAGAAIDRLWHLTEHEDVLVQHQASKTLLESMAKVQDVMLRHSNKIREEYHLEAGDDGRSQTVYAKHSSERTPSLS